MIDNRLSQLQSCYTSVIHDVMREMGLRNFTFPHRITPLQPEKGPILIQYDYLSYNSLLN